MRFLPDGPNIPDELLEERDNGNVVFLCGAGVSYLAGMPDFLGLTRYMVEELGTPEDAPSRTILSRWDDESVPADARPLDQIFNLLQQEYAAGEIDYLIAKRLKTRRGTSIAAHETILRLSKSVDGQPQIITTNFDLLFEKAAARKLLTYVPPVLPDLTSEQKLNGIVYLHGRINSRIKRGEGRQGFVVSSSDFGRAYLAEGWATRFIRDLLDQYTVVLLGYSANDPPVRYLLQGLHTRRHRDRKPIFAFGSGTEEEVQQRWRDSGVRALAYPVTDDAHSALWNTLSAWANRADNPLVWWKRVIDLAKRGPRNLAPHERGQVASLVRTDAGTKLLADADPPPPGEWLCVFDRNVRYGPVGHSFDASQPNFDPLVEYRLDDDPPRPPAIPTPTSPLGDDLLALRSTDRPPNASTRLAGISRQHVAAPLPARLVHLAGWIVKIAHEPVAPWWAAKHVALHPYLLDRIERRVGQSNDETIRPAQPLWRLLIEKFHVTFNDTIDSSWYKTLERIKTESWTNSVLRAFERSSAPYLKIESPSGADGSMPPGADWSESGWRSVAVFEVAFPTCHDTLPDISDAVLPAVYQILRRHLELAAGLLKDIRAEPSFWRTSTFYPEEGAGKYRNEPSKFLFQVHDLFNRMVETQPELLRSDIALWPREELFFFNKLRLWAWTFGTLFSGEAVADGLLLLSDKAFWKEYERRERLHLLCLRWRDLPLDKRKLLERRLVDGRARYSHDEPEDDYNLGRSIESAMMLGWLRKQGCELSDATREALPGLQSAAQGWRPKWDETADRSYDLRGGTFRTVPDPSSIIDAPLSQIIPLAEKYTESSFSDLTTFRPFDGLVKQRLSRAVAALTNTARQDNYPIEFWRSAMQNWPDRARHRLVWLFSARLARLPSEIVAELQHDIFQWLRNHLLKVAAQNQHRALSILDALLNRLFEGETKGIEIRIGSRRTLSDAINSPIDEAVEFLLNLLYSQNLGRGSGLPSGIKSRLECLLTTPGENSDHAAGIIARQLTWLDLIDPEWVHSTVIPWFNLEHPASESAWNGFLYNNQLPEPKLFSLLKPHFLQMFIPTLNRIRDDSALQRLHEFLVIGCFWHQDDPAYISFDEARRALQQTDDAGRAHSINSLNHDLLGRDQERWRRFGKPFLEKAWPKEARFRTERVSKELAELAVSACDLFPEVVETILPYLVPTSQGDMLLHYLTQESSRDGAKLARRFPDATLALLNELVPDNPDQMPYNLDAAVEMVAEAKPSLRQDGRWRRLKDITLRW